MMLLNDSGRRLKAFLIFLRVVQFISALVIVGIFGYFLRVMTANKIEVAKDYMIVAIIGASALAYVIITAALTLCCPGNPLWTVVSFVVDIVAAGVYGFVVHVNRFGASKCTGKVTTVFGENDADFTPKSNGEQDQFTRIPQLGYACKLQTATLAAAGTGILCFLLSVAIGLGLMVARRRSRRGEGKFNGSYAASSMGSLDPRVANQMNWQ